MKHVLVVLTAALILATTACTAAFLSGLDGSATATMANNTPNSQEQMAPVSAHVCGSKNNKQQKDGQHVSGKSSRGHISGKSFRGHISGGDYY